MLPRDSNYIVRGKSTRKTDTSESKGGHYKGKHRTTDHSGWVGWGKAPKHGKKG